MALVEIILVPLVGLLFSAPIFAYPAMLSVLLAAGTLGFAAVGTLFAAMLVRVRSRDTLLPVLLYPITIPVMIAGVRGTAALFQATPDEPMARFWIGAAGVLGRDLPDARALDVRAGHDGVEFESGPCGRSRRLSSDSRPGCCSPRRGSSTRRRTNRRWGWCRRCFTSTSRRRSCFWWRRSICGIHSFRFLFFKRQSADAWALSAAELGLLFGALTLVTGPLWARKAWGVWWVWDPRLTSSLLLFLIFAAYLMLRKYGGPGSDRLAAGMALFGMLNVPFIYVSVNVWRTLHPMTSVVPTLPTDMGIPLWFCFAAFTMLFIALLSCGRARTPTGARRDALLAEDEA